MPRQVTAYGCEYKCGQKVVLSKASMISHESRCFHNPLKKACASCFYFEKEQDDNGVEGAYHNSWVNLICHAGKDITKLQNNCELHELKQQ